MHDNKTLDSLIAKFAHDMASPLGGVIMALDMLETLTVPQESEESLKVLHESVTKMRVLLTLWRTIFSLSNTVTDEEATFLFAFNDYIKSISADLKILMARASAQVWQIRCAGVLLLSLNDRLHLLRNGLLSFDHTQLIFQAEYEKGDLFDRLRKDPVTFEALPLTRQVLPNYIYAVCNTHGIDVTMNSSSPFYLKLTLSSEGPSFSKAVPTHY